MSYKYGFGAGGEGGATPADAFRRAVVANANRGGENVATGALIGALLGAECGYSNLPQDLLKGLAPQQRAMIDEEFERFVKASPFVAAASSAAAARAEL